MKIVTLEPFLTDLVCSLGLREQLVGIPHEEPLDEDLAEKEILTVPSSGGDQAADSELERLLSKDCLLTSLLVSCEADVVLTSLRVSEDDRKDTLEHLRQELSEMLQKKVKVFSYNPFSLNSTYEMFEQLGKDLGLPEKGRDLSQKLKAQFMDWSDNFYDRMKHKKVSFISSVDPLRLGGWWIPDMIGMASAEAQVWSSGKKDAQIEWQDLRDFGPDVILIAPQGMTVRESCLLFRDFEKRPGWDNIPAVKRGEVYFSEGISNFYRPSMRLVESMSILVSAIAGFESGYITPRDSFYKLRWLELQRHQF